MKLAVDARLLDEALRFAFRFSCDDCAHFDDGRERCSLGYPAAPRRQALAGPTLELCKAYELD